MYNTLDGVLKYHAELQRRGVCGECDLEDEDLAIEIVAGGVRELEGSEVGVPFI